MKTPAQDIILAPVITEASMAGIALKKYTFKVATNATKVDVARAAEELFGVKVAKVNTISVRGRFRRQGAHAGYTASSKKSHRHPHQGFQGHRLLRIHGLSAHGCARRIRRRQGPRGAAYGDMTPIIMS